MKDNKSCKLPELQKGIRIQYADTEGKLRAERIYSRNGKWITTINALKEKRRIRVEQVRGYWKPKVKASPNNLIQLV